MASAKSSPDPSPHGGLARRSTVRADVVSNARLDHVRRLLIPNGTTFFAPLVRPFKTRLTNWPGFGSLPQALCQSAGRRPPIRPRGLCSRRRRSECSPWQSASSTDSAETRPGRQGIDATARSLTNPDVFRS